MNTTQSIVSRAKAALGLQTNNTESTKKSKPVNRPTASHLRELATAARAFCAQREAAETSLTKQLQVRDFRLDRTAIERHRDTVAAIDLAKTLEPVLRRELVTAVEKSRNATGAAESEIATRRRQVDATLRDYILKRLPPEAGTAIDITRSPLWEREDAERRKLSDSPQRWITNDRPIPEFTEVLEAIADHLDECSRELARLDGVLSHYASPSEKAA